MKRKIKNGIQLFFFLNIFKNIEDNLIIISINLGLKLIKKKKELIIGDTKFSFFMCIYELI